MTNLDGSKELYHRAVNDFYDVRRKAAVESILGFLQGKSTDLMSYEQVRQKLRPIESARRILEDIPLDRIVGSVNRTTDFSRSFLPRHSSDVQRWSSVRVGVESMIGLPPIDAYRVGDVYFILDGHHRVSVARELGSTSIQGYVIPVSTRVPLSPGDSPDDLIIKSEYADFLAKTLFDHYRPDTSLMVSVPGQYQKLLEHINVHRYFMGENRKQEVTDKEAIVDWHDQVYIPMIQVIRSRNLLRDFPNRTETDLYVWIMDHRAALGDNIIGWEVSAGKVAVDLSNRYSLVSRKRIPRMMNHFFHMLIPETFDPGPASGIWRSERQSPHRSDRLFDDILVTVLDGMRGNAALSLAIEVAKREDARLIGLHVVEQEADKDSEEVTRLSEDFLKRCYEAGVFGRMIVTAGSAADLVCQRSPWVDLSIFRLAYPPPQQLAKRLRSGIRKIIRHSISPLLATPDANFKLDSALLAYGPGRKSEEALFVAAYVAGSWKIPLTVVSVVREDSLTNIGVPSPIERARTYLDSQEIQATFILEKTGDPALAVLLNAEVHNAGFIIIGGYEGHPIKEVFWGSTVDRVLRSTRRPVLICR